MNASMMHRLAPQRGEVIDRAKPFTFTWNGAPFPAYEGDTIVSALAACGVQVFSRSYKYHRPRGILTANYLDPSCMMQVGDEPNVRAAHRLVEPGDEGHGAKRLAIVELRRQIDRWADDSLSRAWILLQDIHVAAAMVAALRACPQTLHRGRIDLPEF